MKNNHLHGIKKEGRVFIRTKLKNEHVVSISYHDSEEVFDERLKTNNRKDVHHDWSLEKCKFRPKNKI